MRVTKPIPIEQIVMDRHQLNPSTLSLVDYLFAGGDIPPIKVTTLGTGQYKIKDGRHRVTALKLLGAKEVTATFSTEPLRKPKSWPQFCFQIPIPK